MLLSVRNQNILIVSFTALLLLGGFLTFKVLQKDADFSIYKARIEGRAEAQKELQDSARSIRLREQHLDSLILQSQTERTAAIEALQKIKAQPVIIKQYNEKINDIKHYGSDDLLRYFSNL